MFVLLALPLLLLALRGLALSVSDHRGAGVRAGPGSAGGGSRPTPPVAHELLQGPPARHEPRPVLLPPKGLR